MDAGLLRCKVAIQSRSAGRNDFGEPEDKWNDIVITRASINPLSGQDFISAMKEQAAVTHKVTIRYNPAVRASMRVKYGERNFDILHVVDTWERHSEMVLMCKELI